jgi:4-amino-4-deoxy-L-arabinose transferase-like glycosyltransferase
VNPRGPDEAAAAGRQEAGGNWPGPPEAGSTTEPPHGGAPRDAAPQRSAATPREGARRAERLALLGILLLALAVRAWYAHFDPTPRRFFDELYALENVGSFLVTGELAPANGYHPSLSYLPQMVVLGGLQHLATATERTELRALGPGERLVHGPRRPDSYPFTPLAYLVGRWTQALIGTVAVALVFLLGRRLGGPRTALVAAALAAVSPQLVRQSAMINEDAALVATLLGALLAAARAGAAPSWRSYLLAGAAVGLACSAKFNGVTAALALLVVTAVNPRDAQGWLRLAGAGLTAAVVFLLLNPFLLLDPQLYATDFGRTVVLYNQKAAIQSGSHLGVLRSAGAVALDPAFLGPVTGAVALLGLALLLYRAASAPPVPRATALAIVAFAAGYPVIFAIVTRGVSRHNWLPLLPLLALAAAHLLHETTHWLQARTPARLGRLLLPALALSAMAPMAAVTYRWATPRTSTVASALLVQRLQTLEGRIVVADAAIGGLVVANRPLRAAIARPAGGELGDAPWRRTDALVALRERAVELPPELAGAASWSGEVTPRFGARRGPALRLYVWGWAQQDAPETLELRCVDRRRLVATSQQVATTAVSTTLWLPKEWRVESIRIAGQDARLHSVQEARRRIYFYSEKVSPAAAGALAVELDVPCRKRDRLAATLLRWHPL